MTVSNEVGFFTIVALLWRYKLLIIGTSFLVGVLAVIFALTAQPLYRAEVTAAEVTDTGMTGIASLANQLGGLASIAGLNLQSTTEGIQPKAVLRSRQLVERFISEYDLLSHLTSPDDSDRPPSLWLAVQRFRASVLSIQEDLSNGLVTVEMTWKDPETAAKWANDFVRMADDVIRTRALGDAERNIDYLNEQITKTHIVELQRVMYNLIENEYQTLMLANGRAEYAFAVVDPAVPPEIRSSPQRTVIALLGTLAGGFLGILIAFSYDAWATYRAGSRRS